LLLAAAAADQILVVVVALADIVLVLLFQFQQAQHTLLQWAVAVLAQAVIQAVMLMLMVTILFFHLLHLQAAVELAAVKTLLKEILVKQVDQAALVREDVVAVLVILLIQLLHRVIMVLQVADFKVAVGVGRGHLASL
jgi:hypothetical protein